MADDDHNFYREKTDMEIARHINLALLMCNGVSDQDFGFDHWESLNDKGLAAIARIIGAVRASVKS